MNYAQEQELNNEHEDINPENVGREIVAAEPNGSQELTEEEIEEFRQNEQLAAAEGNNEDINSKYTPQVGQEFKTRADAHHFFYFYEFLAGFEVVTTHIYRSTSRKK
jgi:hypothetical protein